MSRSASAIHGAAESLNVTGQLDTNHANRNSRNERSNKGRRRRAAAEQRRIDQQRWGQYTEEEEDSATQIPIAPRSNSRRRTRRNNRTNSNSLLHLEEDYYEDEFAFHTTTTDEVSDVFELEMALSLSLSLADPISNTQNIHHSSPSVVNMSYESLSQLESVKCVAPADVVNSMLNITFNGNKSEQVLTVLTDEEEKCAICQCEYECGDHIMSLPCTHGFHTLCGSEWLLNYSKLCPICKLDVTDKKCLGM